ncbi:MarR family winged helix-turn-helix transcriptional regulator [Williamsia sp.]|uniref:MarR family winged helix-turn-helix transcriptional regulator n=1 Tax=Williamsia sp. TaxID=1872085 RepID=UPI002F95F3B8
MVKRLEERVTWLVGRAQSRSHGLLRDSFALADSKPYHYRLLAALGDHGPASQADLGRLTGLDRSDVSGAVEVLWEAGFVERDPDPSDRRRNIVSVTQPGRTELRRLDAVLDRVQEEYLAPLEESERQVFIGLIRRLADG